MKIDNNLIKKLIINWYDSNKRDLPWRKKIHNISSKPYFVLVSEFMLQQTTVNTVKKRYPEFLKKWPTIKELSKASESQILKFWSGLGYYNRAKNRLKSSKIINKKFNGKVPRSKKDLLSLPGIGIYTSNAILGIGYNKPVMAIDANIIRIITRIYGLTDMPSKISKEIEIYANRLILKKRSGDMIQALMDFGSLVCKPRNPICNKCLIKKNCKAFNKKLTDIIPLKKTINKKNKSLKFAHAFVIFYKDKKILLRKRPSKGMLPSMMEIPTSEWLNKGIKKNEIMKTSPLKLNYRKIDNPITYSFSHFDIKITILVGNTNKSKIKNFKWYSLNNINNLELPTLMKVIINKSLKDRALN